MGLFGKILNGLGFYSDEDLKNIENKTQAKKENKNAQNTTCQPNVSSIKLFTPSTQEEVIEIVNFLKNGTSARIDLKMFEGEDLLRAIDFLQGACYVLKIEPIFENNTTILLKQ